MGDRDQSLVGHSEADAPAAPADGGFATRDDDRYREVRVVGSGGLGTVLLAHDQRLDREVALKRIGPGADERSAAARFAREARITARLDHPGIVPIHDAGVTADGRLFYTMRLIRGRSLGEVAAEARDVEARLALVPSLTAACHAVGHAHRRGIVHRDLKPANVMIGEAGETQVVDWGLAEELAQVSGEIVGTPAYLSPEVARGEPAGRAADVWALGAMLHEVLAGERHRKGDREQVISALRRGPEALRWPDGVPAELRAIAAQAMAETPAARYADAETMAADLEAYRDGRRVRAHAYSAAELAWRAVIALRWPLALSGALIVAVIASLALTAHRTERQRMRAVDAEQVARRDRDRAEDALGQVLAAAAVDALDGGHTAQAEILAARALERGESPDARGVLAATTAGPRPERSERIDLPGCTRVVPGGHGFALCHEPGRLELWELSPPRMRWRRALWLDGAVALGTGDVVAWSRSGNLMRLAAADGAELDRYGGGFPAAPGSVDLERTRVVFHDRKNLRVVLASGQLLHHLRPCGDEAIAAAAAAPKRAWVVCARGRLMMVDDDSRVFEGAVSGFGTTYRAASALGIAENEQSLAIGGVGGDVELHDLRPCMADDCDRDRIQRFPAVTEHAIRAIVDDVDGAVVVADDGDAIRISRFAAADVLALPVDGPRAVAIEEGGVVTGGRAWRRWSWSVSAPRRFHVSPGVTVAALSPDGQRIAAAGEDGVVTLTAASGQMLGGLEVGHGGVTALAFTPDGQRLLVTHARGTLQTWSMDDRQILLSETPIEPPAVDVAARLTDTYDDPDILTTARSADGRWQAAATTSGRIDVRELPSRRLVARLHGHRQRATWVAFHGDALWSAGWDGEVLRWNTRAFTAPTAELRAAAEATWRLSVDEVLGAR